MEGFSFTGCFYQFATDFIQLKVGFENDFSNTIKSN